MHRMQKMLEKKRNADQSRKIATVRSSAVALQQLEANFLPRGATKAECRRFLRAFPPTSSSTRKNKEAAVQLQSYLQWRKDHGLPTESSSALPSTSTPEQQQDKTDVNTVTAQLASLSTATSSLSTSDNEGIDLDDAQTDKKHWEIAVQQALMKAQKDRENSSQSVAEENSSKKVSNGSRTPFWKRPQQASANPKTRTDMPQSPSTDTSNDNAVPQLLFCHSVSSSETASMSDTTSGNESDRFGGKQPLRDTQGHRVVQHLPAQITALQHQSHNKASLLSSFETFVSIFGLYLDLKLERHDEEMLTLLIDVRPGRGWANPPALQLVGFIRHVAHKLHDLYPCRLYKCILYPIPRPAIYIWHSIRVFLDPALTKRIVLVPGRDGLDAPPPNKELRKYIHSQEGLDLMEQTRLQSFC